MNENEEKLYMENLKLNIELNKMNEKNARMLKFLKIYENDMDFDCTTILENNLKIQMLEIFKYLHKNYNKKEC